MINSYTCVVLRDVRQWPLTMRHEMQNCAFKNRLHRPWIKVLLWQTVDQVRQITTMLQNNPPMS